MKYLTTKQAAEILNIAPKTLSRWNKEGREPKGVVINSKGLRRYKLSDIEKFLEFGYKK